MVKPVQRAIRLLRRCYNGKFFIYFLAAEVEETLWRIREIMNTATKIDPFVMPYRDFERSGEIVDPGLSDLARWCNSPAIRKSCDFGKYRKRNRGS